MILSIYSPGLLVLFAILLIAIIIGAMYLQFRLAQQSLEIQKDSNAIAEEIPAAVRRLDVAIRKLGPRLHTQPALAEFFNTHTWSAIKTYNGHYLLLEDLIAKLLETGTYHVHMDAQDETKDWDSHDRMLMFSDEGGDLPASRVAVVFKYDNVERSWIGLEGEGTIPVCNGVTTYLPTDCDSACSTEIITLVRNVTKELPVQTVNRPASSFEKWWFYDYSPANQKGWVMTRKNYPNILPAILNLSYPSLTNDGKAEPISVAKILEHLPKVWKDNRVNVCLTGPPNAGKSRLLSLLMSKAAKEGNQILNVKGSLLAKMLEDNAIDELINSDQSIILIIDEAGGLDQKTLSSLNSLMEGVNSSDKLSVVLAFNDLNPITDASTLRKGRVDLNIHVGKLSETQTKPLYEALKTEHHTYKWAELPAGELTLGEVYALGTPPKLIDILA